MRKILFILFIISLFLLVASCNNQLGDATQAFKDSKYDKSSSSDPCYNFVSEPCSKDGDTPYACGSGSCAGVKYKITVGNTVCDPDTGEIDCAGTEHFSACTCGGGNGQCIACGSVGGAECQEIEICCEECEACTQNCKGTGTVECNPTGCRTCGTDGCCCGTDVCSGGKCCPEGQYNSGGHCCEIGTSWSDYDGNGNGLCCPSGEHCCQALVSRRMYCGTCDPGGAYGRC
ncbi:hypothetical protein H6503_03750 [Candidatus Woesearchaeota archaeon]|nr:hypothetical protein [Candidatus Woesearchaeota archaeon]